MKNFFRPAKSVSLLLAGTVLLSSCASTTLIQSYPNGARVYLNDEAVGVTPYRHTDTEITGSITEVRLEKEGYEPFLTWFVRDERVDVGALVSGCLFVFPLLWFMKYKPTHTYALAPLGSETPYDDHLPADEQMSDGQMSTYAPGQANEPIRTPAYQQIRELKQLLDEGAITQAEYDAQKGKLLGDSDR